MPQKFKLTAPDGRSYQITWDKPTPPTPDDVDRIYADIQDQFGAKQSSANVSILGAIDQAQTEKVRSSLRQPVPSALDFTLGGGTPQPTSIPADPRERARQARQDAQMAADAQNQLAEAPGLLGGIGKTSADEILKHQSIQAKVAHAQGVVGTTPPYTLQNAMAEYDMRYPNASDKERARVKQKIIDRAMNNPFVLYQVQHHGESLFQAAYLNGDKYDKAAKHYKQVQKESADYLKKGGAGWLGAATAPFGASPEAQDYNPLGMQAWLDAVDQSHAGIKNFLGDHVPDWAAPIVGNLLGSPAMNTYRLTQMDTSDKKAVKDMYLDSAAGTLNYPVDVMGDVGVLVSTDAKPIDRLGAATNVVLKTDPALALKPFTRVAGEVFGFGKSLKGIVSEGINEGAMSLDPSARIPPILTEADKYAMANWRQTLVGSIDSLGEQMKGADKQTRGRIKVLRSAMQKALDNNQPPALLMEFLKDSHDKVAPEGVAPPVLQPEPANPVHTVLADLESKGAHPDIVDHIGDVHDLGVDTAPLQRLATTLAESGLSPESQKAAFNWLGANDIHEPDLVDRALEHFREAEGAGESLSHGGPDIGHDMYRASGEVHGPLQDIADESMVRRARGDAEAARLIQEARTAERNADQLERVYDAAKKQHGTVMSPDQDAAFSQRVKAARRLSQDQWGAYYDHMDRLQQSAYAEPKTASNNIEEQPNVNESRTTGDSGGEPKPGAKKSAAAALADWRRQSLRQGDSGGHGGPDAAHGQRRGYQALDTGRRRAGVKATFAPTAEAQKAWAQAVRADGSQAIHAPVIDELNQTPAGAKRFHAALKAAQEANKSGASVTLYEPKDYKGMRLFLSQDGKSGFALNGDDIVSVFRHPDSTPGVSPALLQLAVDEGGKRLDCFDTELPHLYGKSGFKAVARLPWDDAYAPEGWNHEHYKGYNGGEPDVVFMAYDPHAGAYKLGDGAVVSSYDEGVAAQKAALENVGKAPKETAPVEPMGDANLSTTEAPAEPEPKVDSDYTEAAQRAQKAAKDVGVKTKADGLIDGFLELFGPHLRGDGANKAMLAMNRRGAELIRLRESAQHLLKAARETFMGMSTEESRAFIDAMESGDHASIQDENLRNIADQLRNFLDQKREAVTALGTGKLENFYQTYFPHIWKDADKAEQVLGQMMSGKGSLEGTKNFLKSRTYATFADGIAAGLEPVSENPVDLVLLKAHEMDKYTTAIRMLQDMTEMGVEPQFIRGDAPAPVGWKYVDDKLFKVFGNEVRIKEAFDSGMREKLMQLAKDLGVNVESVKSINVEGAKRGAWGVESRTGIQRKFAGPNEVLTHELGHAIDRKFNLRKFLFQSADRDTLLQELKDLASKRFASQGDEVSAGYKGYTEKGTELVANLVHAYVHAPELLDQVAPTAAKYLDQFIAKNPVLSQLKDIKPGLELGTAEQSYRAPGSNLMGRWALPEDAAGVFNSYLSPGLRDNKYKFVSEMYRHYVAANNNLNAANLGVSAFHFFTTAFNSLTSEMALGIRDIGQGKVLRGTGKLFKGLSPTTAVRDYRLGAQLQKAYLDLEHALPEHADIIRRLVDAGGRAVPDSNHVNNSIAAFKEAWSQNQYGTVLAKSLPSALQWTSKPLMEAWVPRIKLGAFAQMLRQDLEILGPNATDLQVRNAVTEAYTSVENRMGQLAYDRRFWNNVVRDIAMGGVRSVGWSWGTIDELGGGLTDVMGTRKRVKAGGAAVSHKTAFAAGLPLMVGTYGAIYSYLRFGHGPESPLDLFYWRTGKVNADGSPERIQPPTYMKDVFSYARDLDAGFRKGDFEAATQTIRNKVAPLPSMAWQIAANHDYYGDEIARRDDDWLTRGMDTLRFVGKNTMPFTVQQQLKSVQEGGGVDVGAMAGFTRAPTWVGRTDALELANQYMAAKRPVGGYTPEERDKRTGKSLVERLLRNQEFDKAATKMQELGLSDKEMNNLYDRSNTDKLSGLVGSLEPIEAVRVYEVADSAERELIRQIVDDKVQKALDKADPDDDSAESLRKAWESAQKSRPNGVLGKFH